MRFVFFKTPRPKQFTFKPRHFDEEKERFERRKAELGLNSELSHRESMRAQMHNRWQRGGSFRGASNLSRLLYFAFYAFVIVGGVYLIFFTDFVDKLVALFGVGR